MSTTKTTKSTGVRLTRVFAGFYSYRGRFTYHVLGQKDGPFCDWAIDVTEGARTVRRMRALSLKEARQMIASMESAA